MNKILTNNEINQFNNDGAIFLKGKFDIEWIEKLKKGIKKDIENPIKGRKYFFEGIFILQKEWTLFLQP